MQKYGVRISIHVKKSTHIIAKKLGWQAYLDGRGILREEERQI